MSKAKRFEGLADLAGSVEAQAALRLAENLRAVQAKEAALEELRGYMEEYRQLTESGEKAVDTARWKNSRLFLSRLNDAVNTRESELREAALKYREEVKRWRDTHHQAKALEKLVDKYYREELLASQRREQKELDEQAVRPKKSS